MDIPKPGPHLNPKPTVPQKPSRKPSNKDAVKPEKATHEETVSKKGQPKEHQTTNQPLYHNEALKQIKRELEQENTNERKG